MSTVSFKAFKLHETNVPVGVVTRFATIGESASGSVFVSLLYTKATIASRQLAHKNNNSVLHTVLYLVSTVFLIITEAKVDRSEQKNKKTGGQKGTM